MDYPVTTATDMPNVQAVDLDLAPSPTNPLGVKGAGEGGIVATAAVLGNALSHALHTYGVQVTELPLSPTRVREMMQGK
jgi:carbon-monoxide dehydrogenase large subunit